LRAASCPARRRTEASFGLIPDGAFHACRMDEASTRPRLAEACRRMHMLHRAAMAHSITARSAIRLVSDGAFSSAESSTRSGMASTMAEESARTASAAACHRLPSGAISSQSCTGASPSRHPRCEYQQHASPHQAKLDSLGGALSVPSNITDSASMVLHIMDMRPRISGSLVAQGFKPLHEGLRSEK